ncbi:MAG: MFS transporter [Euzebyales bacterium]|jgi:MFS family permease|nr:MFS transporter [Euzebyales bacterium]
MGLGRNYRWLWSAGVTSNLADGVYGVTLPLLAIRLTDAPAEVAAVRIATSLPWLLLALHAGALADRLDRRALMRGVSLARALGLGLLAWAVAAGAVTLPLLYAVAFVVAAAEVVFDTSAQSLLPAVVDRDRLAAANGRLYAAEITAGELAGPPLGGALVGLSAALALLGGAGAYVVVALLLTGMGGAYRPGRTGTSSVWADVREGLAYLLGHRLLLTLAVLTGAVNMLWYMWLAVFVLYAVDPGPMGLSELGYGLIFTGSAAGGVVGTLLVERLDRRVGRLPLLTASLVGWALFEVGPALTASAWVVGGLVGVGSVGGIMWGVAVVSLRQRIVPDELLGRVNAAYRLISWGALPLGALIGGLLGEVIGLRPLFGLTAAATLALIVPLRLTVTEAAIADAEDS